MKLAHGLSIDSGAEPSQASTTLASWYAPGLSDELGDRLLMFDNSSAPSLELLRFRQSLATPGFEVALRRRVERLSHFRHPAFARVRAVEYLGSGDGLALLSNHTPGKRLSDVLQDVRGPAFAAGLIRQLTPALASLQQYEGGGHGALAPSRIVVTPEGRLTIIEHVLGPAIERLQLSPERLRTELGIALPPATAAHYRLDSQTDYFQLGLIALSLLLGRRLGPNESRDEIARLLEQVTHAVRREAPVLSGPLTVWLERALQLNDQLFESAGDAEDALLDLAAASTVRQALPAQPVPSLAVEAPPDIATVPPTSEPAPLVLDVPPDLSDEPADPSPSSQPDPAVPVFVSEPVIEPADAPFPEPVEPSPAPPQAESQHGDRQPEPEPVAAAPPPVHEDPEFQQDDREPQESGAAVISLSPGFESATPAPPVAALGSQAAEPDEPTFVQVQSIEPQPEPVPAPVDRPAPAQAWLRAPRGWSGKPRTKGRQDVMRALVSALAMCAVGEGFVIAGLLLSRGGAAPAAVLVETATPGADVLVDGRPAGVTPLQLDIAAGTRSIRVVDPRPAALEASAQAANAPATPPRPDVGTAGSLPAPARRSGGIRLVSPIDVEVFEGDKLLGSSATGIVSLAAGRHQLDLVNSRLGYRGREVVNVRSGQVVPLRVSPPNGRLSINALPWAEVWIGGRLVGETPLGNLSVPLGEHEIVFRHPQLGEQRHTAVVRLDTVTRVSANLQR